MKDATKSGNRPLHIGMSLAPTWLSGEAWRRPDSGVEGVLGSEYFIDIARRAEAAKLDFVFRPDTLYLNTDLLETSIGTMGLDPTLLLAAIARETSHIGLLTTASTTFYPPYILARMIQSLNWLSNGRAGWNIVTALDGQENFSMAEMPSPEERYARAAEVTEVVTRLWASFPQEAWEIDRDGGRYVNSDLVQPIDFKGAYHQVKGPLGLPDMADARIPLVQAGASEAGRAFASRVADAIFAATPDRDAAVELRRDLRARAVAHGRSADAIRVMPGLSLYLAETETEARELYRATHARADDARKRASVKAMTGLDLTGWARDRKIAANDLPPPPEKVRSRTHSDLLRRMIQRSEPTVAELLQAPEVIGSAHWQVIGTVGQAVDAVRDWQAAGAIDGFIAVPGGSVASMHRTLEDLAPALSDLGLLRAEYSGSTFADHFGDGG